MPIHKALQLKNSYGEQTWTLLDVSDYNQLKRYKFHVNPQGYAVGGRIIENNVNLHRIITKAGAGDVVDHQNRHRLDNRGCNLIIGSVRSNNYNRGSKRKADDMDCIYVRERKKGPAYYRVAVSGAHVKKCKNFDLNQLDDARAWRDMIRREIQV